MIFEPWYNICVGKEKRGGNPNEGANNIKK